MTALLQEQASPPDQELVIEFARTGSDAAFHALVRRHVDLVYATAFRQLGDRGMAEEVTQNVFVSLARKAPKLAGVETLAGWLHRATVLEARSRVRSELRRRERESTAGQLADLHAGGVSALEALVPLLDEALLQLRDADRTALILRFMEDRSLREVGSFLGVDEDAARKRVSRALGRVEAFFQRRGFLLSGGASSGAAALIARGTQAAPVSLAAGVAAAGLQAAGTVGGTSALWISIMTLSKTQLAIVCLVIASAPLIWQWNARSAVEFEVATLDKTLKAQEAELAQLNQESERVRLAWLRADAEGLGLRARLADLPGRRRTALEAGIPWDPQSLLIRIPKSMLKQLPLSAVSGRSGQLSASMREALQLSDEEGSAIEAALQRFLTACRAVESKAVQRVDPPASELNGHTAEEVRAFSLPDLSGEISKIRAALLQELAGLVDGDRLEILVRGLSEWLPAEGESTGVNSSMAVFGFAHQVLFYRTPDQSGEQPYLFWRMMDSAHGRGMGLPIPISEIPSYLVPQVRDWITEAQAKFDEARLHPAAPVPKP
jgi:RNA polymerase sigma factor (sigma-70 family)